MATLVRLARGIYPPLLEEQGVGAALRQRSIDRLRARDRGRRARGGALPRARRGGGVLLLPRGPAERRQARGRRPHPGRRWTGRPDELAISVEDDGAGFDPAVGRRAAPGWRTCATASSRSAGRCASSPRPVGAPGCAPVLPPALRPRSPRTGCLTCAPGSPGSLAVVTVVLVAVDVVVSAQAVPLPLGDGDRRARLPVRPRRGGRLRDHGRAHHLPLRPAPDRLAAQRSSASPAPSRCSRRPTPTGSRSATAPGRPASPASSAWLAALIGGQLAIAGLALMFLLAPDGHLVSRRWRYVACGASAIGEALLLPRRSCPWTRPTFDLVTQSDDVGPVRGLMLTVGFIADQRRSGRLGRLRWCSGCARAAASSASSCA